MWWQNVVNYVSENLWLQILLEAYLIFIVIAVLLYVIAYSRRAFYLIFFLIIIICLRFLASSLKLPISEKVYDYAFLVGSVLVVCVLAPDFRNLVSYKQDVKDTFISSSEKTKLEIVEAVSYLSNKKIGALITIEGHNSLDQYAERAIQLNSEVSKELLINIFTPNTPLHDGAVIVRGNKIRCAGAYYVLTQHSEIDKTTGSRHRAGIGISEVTDSLTIIVSEETGKVSITMEGFLISMNDENKLMEYIEMFVDKK